MKKTMGQEIAATLLSEDKYDPKWTFSLLSTYQPHNHHLLTEKSGLYSEFTSKLKEFKGDSKDSGRDLALIIQLLKEYSGRMKKLREECGDRKQTIIPWDAKSILKIYDEIKREDIKPVINYFNVEKINIVQIVIVPKPSGTLEMGLYAILQKIFVQHGILTPSLSPNR